MAADRYTKTVLTVIAVCLVWLSLGGPSFMTPVSAQNDRVVLAGWIDERGSFRSLPIPPGSGQAQPGQSAPATPMPIWQTNR